MSMAYKCDRCGEYFEPNDIFWNVKGNGRVVAGLYKYNSDGNRRDMDICPECYNSLEEWMFKKGGDKSD